MPNIGIRNISQIGSNLSSGPSPTPYFPSWKYLLCSRHSWILSILQTSLWFHTHVFISNALSLTVIICLFIYHLLIIITCLLLWLFKMPLNLSSPLPHHLSFGISAVFLLHTQSLPTLCVWLCCRVDWVPTAGQSSPLHPVHLEDVSAVITFSLQGLAQWRAWWGLTRHTKMMIDDQNSSLFPLQKICSQGKVINPLNPT